MSSPSAQLGKSLADLQHELTARWHISSASLAPAAGLEALIHDEHRANFDLWHEEDKARNPVATDTEVAAVKRRIDQLNQQRNDLVERVDEFLLAHLPPASLAAPLHSETPGMMLDRLSILSLKLFHTDEQIRRSGVTPSHVEKNRARLAILEEQRADLTAALVDLLNALDSGEKRLKLYRQMKMYNDPDLNPEVYKPRRG